MRPEPSVEVPSSAQQPVPEQLDSPPGLDQAVRFKLKRWAGRGHRSTPFPCTVSAPLAICPTDSEVPTDSPSMERWSDGHCLGRVDPVD